MSLYYDRAGNSITVEEWAKAFEYGGNVLKKTTVGEAEVSTVWLGVDHSFGSGAPLLFETMIFGEEHDHPQWRYPTEAEALAHHDALAEALRKGEPLPDGSGTTCTCGTTRPDEQTHTPDCAITKEVTK